MPMSFLWVPTTGVGSPVDRHQQDVRRKLEAGHRGGGPGWRYDPEAQLAEALADPAALGERFAPWTRACAEMARTGRGLLAEIRDVRENGAAGARVGLRRVAVGRDRVGEIHARGQAGTNGGRSTKSKLGTCPASSWRAVTDTFGLAGAAAYPNIAVGCWWMALLSADHRDWRQHYIALLDHAFYFEYNVDRVGGGRTVRELELLWDMPGLEAELRARRLHMACEMAYFDTKRRNEAEHRGERTDGRSAWVYADRDSWRDSKASDSGIFGHYLSFPAGTAGRDDMMVTGLVNDWVDLGPDLRHEESGQSVLALTRGSIVQEDLLDCYERTVWMMNAQLTPHGYVKGDRYSAAALTVATCVWQMCNHRQDLWRYFALASDLCESAAGRDLYAAGQLADCYTPSLVPITLPRADRVTAPRRPLRYDVLVDGARHRGELDVHEALADGVEDGVLPMLLVEYGLVVPLLLRDGRIDADTFLRHMDRTYCDHFAAVVRSGHVTGFSPDYAAAVVALVMEQWWHGIWFAIGAGSLIEAQPDLVAADRSH
ncbi:hypothetical protein [Streptomyces sp. NRRL WC-3742]|uniref:hypothetical protein n=1 Tax=Streptomyces sp. NRRL WC-3742 TaxID=1463934 RepID=UPI001F15AFA0|nr:hypothetical protein [Streptomyces sp. NRRL WC-3742]